MTGTVGAADHAAAATIDADHAALHMTAVADALRALASKRWFVS